jgi:hypothetical protein
MAGEKRFFNSSSEDQFDSHDFELIVINNIFFKF